MKRRVTRIAPWQAGKVSALLYFALGLLLAIPLGVLNLLFPPPPAANAPGAGFFFALPFLYALAGAAFVPLVCWIYNVIARFVGGIEISVEDEAAGERR